MGGMKASVWVGGMALTGSSSSPSRRRWPLSMIPAYSPFGRVTPERYTRLVEFLATVFKRLPFYK